MKLGVGPFAVEVDLMQPLDENKSPKVHIPPLNHLGLWVDDLQVAVTHLQGQGVRFAPGGIRKGAGGHDVAFIHPKGNEASPLSGEGVLIELVQAPREVIDAFDAIAKANLAARYAAYRQATGGSWMTPNETRRLDNLPPIEGGDELLLQAGKAPADQPSTPAQEQNERQD